MGAKNPIKTYFVHRNTTTIKVRFEMQWILSDGKPLDCNFNRNGKENPNNERNGDDDDACGEIT